MSNDRVWKENRVTWASSKQVEFTFQQLELIFFQYNYEGDYISVNFRTASPKTRNTENRSVKTIVFMKSRLEFQRKIKMI